SSVRKRSFTALSSGVLATAPIPRVPSCLAGPGGSATMGYFAWPYRVLFQDTMAYGWHHFLTNFKFQCEARENFLFQVLLATPEGRAECEDLVLLTHDGYSRNLAPVPVGETVGILLSHE